MKELKTKLILAAGLIFVAAISRFIPHPPNFTPVLGMAIFGGAVISDKKFAFAVPLAAMFLSDLVLGFHPTLLAVYLTVAAITAFGFIFKKVTVRNVAVSSVAASVLFFITTNFAYWLTGVYPMNFGGLMLSYEMAIPFFGNTLAGTVISTAALFSFYLLVERFALKPVKAEV